MKRKPARTSKRATASAGRKRTATPPPAPGPCVNPPDCLLQQAVAGLATGFLLVDRADRIVYLNRAGERLLGISAAECLGRVYRRIMRDPQIATFWERADCDAGNCLGNVTVHYPQQLELKVNATRCTDPNGHELGRALLFCDVTSDRNVKMELTQELASRLRELADDPGAPPKAVASLTQRELHTLRAVGRGLSNVAVAQELDVTFHTVRAHLKRIYRKLGLKSRAEAVRFATRHHLA